MSGLESTGADVATRQADKLSLRVVDWVVAEAKTRLLRRRDATAAKRLLQIDQDPEVAYRSASVHSLFRDGVHPDNFDPLVAFVGDDLSRARDPADLRVDLEVLEQLSVPLGQSQVRFGSPTSDGGTRVLFGYGGEGESNRLIRKVEPFEMPFRWELEDVGERLAYRYVRGKGKVGRPLWRIVGGKDNTPYAPEPREDGLLKTDYLLVTRVPNYLGDGRLAGKFIVNFGGAHGTGTRAVELLVGNRKELARAHNSLRDLARRARLQSELPRCFQLLFEIGGIEHDPQLGSRGTEIRLLGSGLIEDNDNQWKDAARLIRPALEEVAVIPRRSCR